MHCSTWNIKATKAILKGLRFYGTLYLESVQGI